MGTNDYKQTEVAGTRWHRFSRVVINNPRGGTPSVSCLEQEVLALGGGEEIVRDVGNLDFVFNPQADFPLLNPDTNEVLPVEQFNALPRGSQTYILVYSYTLAEAAKRDASGAQP